MTNPDEHRLHELTYAELGKLYHDVVTERDRWHDIARNLFYNRAVGEEMYGQIVAEREEAHAKAVREMNEAYEKTTKSSIQESVEFVVNMMNEGVGIDPNDVYPRNRYHGD